MNDIEIITYISIKNDSYHNLKDIFNTHGRIKFNPIIEIYNYRYKKQSLYKKIYKQILRSLPILYTKSK